MTLKRNVLNLFSLLVIALTFIVLTSTFNKAAIAAGSPLQISPVHNSATSPCGTFYNTTYTFTYNGGTVWMSGLSDGNGNVYTDDKLDIQVTRPDGTTVSYSKNYGNGQAITPTVPQNLTSRFQTGDNQVTVLMTDIIGPVCNSSAYWLVETTGSGGGSGAPKPNILPRSTWHGDSSGVIQQQTVNHIVVHHTRTSNDPGGYGTMARELWYSFLLQPVLVFNGVFSPPTILSIYGDYTSIRGTWPGEAWLVWLEHKKITGYTDIGYQYLIDPLGNIYEGRFKGSLAENADNKGLSPN